MSKRVSAVSAAVLGTWMSAAVVWHVHARPFAEDRPGSAPALYVPNGRDAARSTAMPQNASPRPVAFATDDGWTIHGDLYGTGDRGVLLVHGGRFTKESWLPQARALVAAGFRVLAIDLRGFGASTQGPAAFADDTHRDVLAAVRFLRADAARSVSVVGASMGGDAAEGALRDAAPGDIDRVVFLAHGAYGPAEHLRGRKLFIVTRDDANAAGPRLPRIQKQYDAAPAPKELVVLDGAAHAQFVFETDQGPRAWREIMQFLTAP